MMDLANLAIPAISAHTRKGIISNTALGILIYFQYNPQEIEETKSLDWQETPILGVGQPLLSYGGGGARTKRFTILLDAHASPHPLGHVALELAMIRTLTVPFDVSGKPTMKLPDGVIGAFANFLGSAAGAWLTGSEMPRKPPEGPGRVSGVPPMVKIVYGGRIERGVIRNLEIREELHGTTPQARMAQFCTRATVTFEFIVVEDTRMVVHWRAQQP